MIPLETIAKTLAGERQPQKTATGYLTLCPCHADSNFSLHVSQTPDGRLLYHDHGGCSQETLTVWMKENGYLSGNGERLQTGKPRIVATYDYQDSAGKLVFQVCRKEPGKDGKKKDFLQRRPDPANPGKWLWNLKGVERIPYRLPELLKGDIIFIAEGEKDCDKLAAMGLTATTNAGGAGKWRKDYNSHFQSKAVVILPDNDDPGRAHALDVARNLHSVAASVKVVEFPGLPEKGDISDWLRAHGSKEKLLALVEAAPEWKPTPGAITAPEDPQTDFTEAELLNFARDGQVGDARLFIRLFREKYCYDHAAGIWYEWGGHYWLEDEKNKVLMALDHIVDLYTKQAMRYAWKKTQATREGDQEAAKRAEYEESIFLKKIAQLQRGNYRHDVLSFAAAGDGSLGITGKEWDKATFLLPCVNGTYDLKNSSFHAGEPKNYIKIACPTEWRGFIEQAPEWVNFLNGVFDDDQELIAYVQRLAGYAISGQRSERVLPIFTGQGWNGKGTFFETIHHVLGDLAGPVPAEIILEESRHNQKTGGAPTPELMALRGKRLVWASETNEGKRLNAGKAKWLTGGDTLVGRSLYGKRMVSFAPTHTIFLITNHRPKANPDDYALWGRLHIVPFDLSFVDNPDPANSQERQRDKELADKLKTEAPGILAWIVRGFDDWQKWGLDAPEKVKVATESYRQNEDTVGQFIEERCVLVPGAQVKASELYAEYKKWCEENGFKPIWGRTFSERMARKFEKTDRTKDGIFYKGLWIMEEIG